MTRLVDASILEAIVQYSKRAPIDGLVCMAQGNVSARDPATGYIAITPHDYAYEKMRAADLVIVDLGGKKVAGDLDPSFETPVHCAVYRARREAMAIVHTEPPFVNAFGAVHREIQPITTTLLKTAGGPIKIMPYSRSGSPEFAAEMLRIMGSMNVVIWANHGMLVVGPNVETAYNRSVAIEQGARTYFLALQLGQPSVLKDFFKVVEGK